jgi:hypothetical protein
VPFLLYWTDDEWQHSIDTASQASSVDVHFADVPVGEQSSAPIRFTFLWLEDEQWEGKDYIVHVVSVGSDDGERAR